jgi:hypothetical protein
MGVGAEKKPLVILQVEAFPVAFPRKGTACRELSVRSEWLVKAEK